MEAFPQHLNTDTSAVLESETELQSRHCVDQASFKLPLLPSAGFNPTFYSSEDCVSYQAVAGI